MTLAVADPANAGQTKLIGINTTGAEVTLNLTFANNVLFGGSWVGSILLTDEGANVYLVGVLYSDSILYWAFASNGAS